MPKHLSSVNPQVMFGIQNQNSLSYFHVSKLCLVVCGRYHFIYLGILDCFVFILFFFFVMKKITKI